MSRLLPEFVSVIDWERSEEEACECRSVPPESGDSFQRRELRKQLQRPEVKSRHSACLRKCEEVSVAGR